MSEQQQNPQKPTRPLPEGEPTPGAPPITPPSPNLPATPPERHPETEVHQPPPLPQQPPTEPAQPGQPGPVPTPGLPGSDRPQPQPDVERTPTGAPPSEQGKPQSKDQQAQREMPEPDTLEQLIERGGGKPRGNDRLQTRTLGAATDRQRVLAGMDEMLQWLRSERPSQAA